MSTRPDTILERLESVLTVADVMVPADRLTTATSLEEASKLHESTGFYVIPTTENGRITKYHIRGEGVLHDVSEDVSLRSSSGIMDLIDFLVHRKFCFVSGQDVVAGFVHFSDLNGHVVSILLFALVESLERHLCERLGVCRDLTESAITRVLVNTGRTRTKAYRKLVKNEADIDLTSVLYFGELLEVASHFKVVNLTVEDIKQLNDFRIRVCHSAKPLVVKHDDVAKAAWAKDRCLSLVAGLQRRLS